MAKVHPYLMSSPREQIDFKQCFVATGFLHFILCNSLFAIVRHNAFYLPVNVKYWQIYFSTIFNNAVCYCKISFFNLVGRPSPLAFVRKSVKYTFAFSMVLVG